jgi:hypothetical protein
MPKKQQRPEPEGVEAARQVAASTVGTYLALVPVGDAHVTLAAVAAVAVDHGLRRALRPLFERMADRPESVIRRAARPKIFHTPRCRG